MQSWTATWSNDNWSCCCKLYVLLNFPISAIFISRGSLVRLSAAKFEPGQHCSIVIECHSPKASMKGSVFHQLSIFTTLSSQEAIYCQWQDPIWTGKNSENPHSRKHMKHMFYACWAYFSQYLFFATRGSSILYASYAAQLCGSVILFRRIQAKFKSVSYIAVMDSPHALLLGD